MTPAVRNVLIVLAAAAAVAALPAASFAAGFTLAVFNVIFFVLLAFFGGWFYRRFRNDLYALGDRWRAILYFSIAAALLTVSATPQLWETGPGTLVWFAVVGAASYAVFATYRRHQQHW